MQSTFSTLDWLVFGLYFLVITVTSVMLSRTKIESSRDFFITKNHMSTFAVAISVIATSQSAATFLGA
ncbi:MAG: sodium:solute symporter, partial [Sulfurimonas sp.]|nr:sodium:solute symporter [Sulfurimonas sp.]